MIRIEASLFNVQIMKFSPPSHQPNYVQVLFYCIFLPSRLNRGKVNLVFDPHLIGDFTIKIFKPRNSTSKLANFVKLVNTETTVQHIKVGAQNKSYFQCMMPL